MDFSGFDLPTAACWVGVRVPYSADPAALQLCLEENLEVRVKSRPPDSFVDVEWLTLTGSSDHWSSDTLAMASRLGDIRDFHLCTRRIY